MELTLNIPESLVKKIKALSALEGGVPEGFEKMIVNELEVTVSNKIMNLVAGTSDTVRVPYNSIVTANFRGVPEPEVRTTSDGEMHLGSDYTPEDVAAGLGDEEDDDIGQKVDTYDMVPETGGLTDEELDNDMRIEDPNTEAISDEYRGTEDGSVSPEALFSSNLDLPPPPPTARDPRIERKEKHRRALAKTRRAKVSHIIGEPR